MYSCLNEANMSEKNRALPSWMSKKEEKVKEKEQLKSRRKHKAARAAFYCMNERELTEAAVSYLTCEDHVSLLTDQKLEDKTCDSTVKMKGKTATSKTIVQPVTEALEEESSDCGDAQETTYDLDITEEQTVPYTEIPQPQGSEGQRSESVQDPSSPVSAGLQADKRQAHSQMPEDAVEDDALRLVREIFFT